MFSYLSPEAKFWLALLGHATISVGLYVEQQQILVGDKATIASCLQTSAGLIEVERLAASGMLVMKHIKINGKWQYEVRWNGWKPIPGVRQLCYVLAEMMDDGMLTTKEIGSMPWYHLFNKAAEYSDGSERAGVKPFSTIEVCVPQKEVKRSKPYIVVNGNQRATKTGFKTLVSRENYVTVFSKSLGEALPANVLSLPMAEPEEEVGQSGKMDVDWQGTPIEQWNSFHLVNWIVSKYVEVYGKVPYNRKVLLEFGIKVNGIDALERLQPDPTGCPMAEFKRYTEWLFEHKTFTATPSNLTSPKIMQIFLVDAVHSKKQEHSALPQAFNL